MGHVPVCGVEGFREAHEPKFVDEALCLRCCLNDEWLLVREQQVTLGLLHGGIILRRMAVNLQVSQADIHETVAIETKFFDRRSPHGR